VIQITAGTEFRNRSVSRRQFLPRGGELRGISRLLTDGESTRGNDEKRLTNLIVFAIAIVYFLLDALFATIAIPLSRWIASHGAFARIHRWILSLRPYPTLLLFIVPLILLEPAKPAAAWLVATGRTATGLSVLAIAEIPPAFCRR
jgi:hypothetical protein